MGRSVFGKYVECSLTFLAMLLSAGQHAVAQEKHFLKELSLKELVETLIVTQSSAGAADVQRQLQAAGVRGSFSLREGGFLSYLRDDDALEAFLTRAAP